MINGFDIETQELNEYESQVLMPIIIKGLITKVGKDKAVTSGYICSKITEAGLKINPAKLRKIIHEIRITGAVANLIATNKGYYISKDKEELEKYIESLHQRESSIAAIRKKLIYQLNGI